MSPVSDPHPARSNTRRKIIQAGFGVPVISAVASGSALAATSATCLARQVNSPVFRDVTTSATADNYRRVQLGRRTVGNTSTYYVDGNNLVALGLKRNASYQLSANQYQEFNIGTNREVGSVLTSVPNGTGSTYTSTGTQWAVLRFNANGEVVGVGRSDTGGSSAVTGSCWSSLNATA